MAVDKVQELMARGSELHSRGQLEQAEALYRQAISLRPNYADALCLLGVLCAQKEKSDMAVELLQKAIAIAPAHAMAHFNLGNVMRMLGRSDEAGKAYGNAIRIRPDYVQAHLNLGFVLASQRQTDEAIAEFRAATRYNPRLAEAWEGLGSALVQKGELDQGIQALQSALAIKPNFAMAHNNIGTAYKEKGLLEQALIQYRTAIRLHPEFAEAHCNAGAVLTLQGQLEQAVASFNTAIGLKAEYAEAHFNLGVALDEIGRRDQAFACFARAVQLKPNFSEAYTNLGNSLKKMGKLDEAVAHHRRAIELNPALADAHTALANTLKDRGAIDEAIAAYRTAIRLKPGSGDAHGNLIFIIHLHPNYDAQMIAQEHGTWNRTHAEGFARSIKPHGNDRDPDRRLRIGYVSPDFRKHAVGRFLLQLMSNHDKSRVEIYAYSQVRAEDEVTHRLRASADCWRNIVGLSDDQTADLIRQDQIDVLVDLTMHLACNRILVFARKPAPVQVTHLAYCSTTGLETMDYRMSDPYLDPPGEVEPPFPEKPIRLGHSYWCYDPGIETPMIGPLPSIERGFVTFGCLNNFCKVNASTLKVWAGLLRAAPKSQVLLHAHEGSHRQETTDFLEREGMRARVHFVGKCPIQKYFDLYNGIDIALDTFPYAGGTTSCDAMWMGVPVISLAGKTAVGRAGVSILNNVGLPELVARSTDEYVKIAANLSEDRERLIELRSNLRELMIASPLMNGSRYADEIEDAFRTMWRTWCQSRQE